ncbi:helix-turn-helix domain-containing protein [Vibrio alginolyticus]
MSSVTSITHPLNRIQNVLDYIHSNLELTLSVDDISQRSCWSRWQLQRVFQQHTGLSVAHYVRELKLSYAAERLINSTDRSLDIAIEMGFSSENVFSRAFKQMFSVSPREYRRKQQLTGLRQPLSLLIPSQTSRLETRFVDVKIETKPSFYVTGIHHAINGLFSSEPDFQSKVPRLWNKVLSISDIPRLSPSIGVVDVTRKHSSHTQLEYWAGFQSETGDLPSSNVSSIKQFDTLYVPQQTYAVVTHIGKATGLAKTLEWFILDWLPYSNYRGVDGYELEIYPEDYQLDSNSAQMQYWLPVKCIAPLLKAV